VRVLVVAGEPSGDRALAAVIAALAPEQAFGIGGDGLEATGVRLLAHVRDVSGMGLAELAVRAPAIARATAELLREIRASRPTLAILASWSAANARIGSFLRGRGIPVVWVSPPEVWAWGTNRAARLARCADRFVVTLPFEEAIWRAVGADARYLGHPALDVELPSRAAARSALAISDDAAALALLPGSRAGEIERLLPLFLQVAHQVKLAARVLLAPSIPRSVHAAARRAADSFGVGVVDAPADRGALALLPAFDAALVASGTASLECALSGVPPVVAYRLHPLTMAIARRLVRTPRIALPNVILGRHAFPERIQEGATAENLAQDIRAILQDQRAREECAAVASIMREGLPPTTWAARVAALVAGLRC
jgi:lipid-A-disaccharide synthase